MTSDQEKFCRRVFDHGDEIAARKSLSDQIEEDHRIFAQVTKLLTASQIAELSRQIFEQNALRVSPDGKH